MKAIKYFICFILLTLQPISAQNFWHQTNGPYGVPTVYDFLLYNDSTIFLATDEGIIKSFNNGEDWERISGYYTTWQCYCITKNKFGVLYAGMHNVDNNSKKLIKSTDYGNNWVGMSTNYDADIRYIFIPYKDTIMLGTWDLGVIRSFDAGVTWTRVNNGNIYNGIYEITQLDDGNVLAGSAGGGVFKTTNWGDLWIPSNTGLPANSQGYRFAKSFCKTTSDCLFVGTQVAIYYSTNNGESWSFKSAGLTNKEINRIKKDVNGILYAGTDMGNGVYYSTNGGDYWYHLGLGLTTYTLGWDSETRLYAGGSSQGLYRFIAEDSTWFQVYNQGYTPVEVNDICLTKGGNLFASTEWWGLQYTSNNGELWTRTNYQGNKPYAIESINDSIIIIGRPDDCVVVSNDTGKTWNVTGNFTVLSLYYEPSSQIIYMGTSSYYSSGICGIYISSDFGQNWTLLYEFPHAGLIQSAFELYVTKTKQVILVSQGNAWPPYSKIYYLYQSTDHGINWQVLYEDYNHPVTSILQDVNSTLYALGYEKLMISEDEGQTWITRISAGRTVLVSDYSGRIYKDNGVGIQYSTDKGITWVPVDNSGLNNWVNDIVVNQDNRIFLATTAGVYFGEADSIVVSVEKIKPVNIFFLYQNYPNPFNPITKIEFRIADFGFVSLKVFDILGNEIATLVSEEKHPGTYEVEFSIYSDEGRNLSSGIYFYQLQAGIYIETKKMVLIK